MSERDVRLEGLRIRVRDVGAGPPLLLINGLGAPTGWWRALEARLDGLRVLSFDAPGVGRSQTPWRPVGPEELAAIAAGVLDTSDVEQADVLGYSLGGMVAQEVALGYPTRVRRLVLAATSCGLGAVPASLVNLLTISTPLRYMSERLYDSTTAGLLGGRARTDPEFAERHKQRRFEDRPNKLGYAMQVMSLQRWSSLSKLSRIEQPTLVVAGDDDPLMRPANGYILARRIPNARLHVAAGEGHLLLMDDESVAFAAIGAFLRAPTLEEERVWQEAFVVDDAAVDAALTAAGRSPQPLAVIGSVLRRLHPAPEAGGHSPV
jgi:pimeloyl-ACP methyl ester carboxylesterase